MTSKYKNSILYLHKGVIYKQFTDHDDTYYKSATDKILSDEQKKESEFFDSILECETYRHLKFWVSKFKEKNPNSTIKLVRQFPVVLIPHSKIFPEYKHRVDFALLVKWDGDDHNTVYLVESKGIITKDSMIILRLLELQYKGISSGRYIMVFARFPEKYPKYFPRKLATTTLESMIQTLNEHIKPIK